MEPNKFVSDRIHKWERMADYYSEVASRTDMDLYSGTGKLTPAELSERLSKFHPLFALELNSGMQDQEKKARIIEAIARDYEVLVAMLKNLTDIRQSTGAQKDDCTELLRRIKELTVERDTMRLERDALRAELDAMKRACQ